MKYKFTSFTLSLGLGVLNAHPQSPSEAQDKGQEEPKTASQGEAAAPKGLLPVPDYSGDFWSRHTLSGDWGGARTDLANKGVQIEVSWSQYVQGVTSGGRDTGTEYGGKGNYLVYLDLMRMGVLPGALVKFRGESRYGDSVNGISGSILPVNTEAFFPLTKPLDDEFAFTVTDLTYVQFLSEKLGVAVGKMDTLDGDPNEFASGRGMSQFMNANFNFNPVVALRLPYSTLGAALICRPTERIMITSTLLNTIDSSTTTGFDDFGDGNTWNTEADFQYRLGRLPGGQNIGVLYSFDQDFAQVGGQLIFQPGEGLSLQQDHSTWAIYWSGWQYLWVEDPTDAPIHLADGVADHQGIGLFTRVGFADQDTNPVEWSASGGFGGRGLIPTRDNDTIGIGYYYTSIQSTRLNGIANPNDHTQGFEAFYNIAVTPAAHLALDVQLVDSLASNVDTGVVLGARLGLTF